MDAQNHYEDIGRCCPPITKLKPLLIGGIIIYAVLLFLDIYYFGFSNLFTFSFLIIILSFFTFNRCFLRFQWFTIISIFLIVDTVIPLMGIIIQTGFKNQDLIEEIKFFVVYLFS